MGIPWDKNRHQEFSDSFSYLGFYWDLPNKTVSLPNLKCKKYIRKLSSLISACERAQVFKAHVKTIIGTLTHVTFVYWCGHSYMSNLYKWLTSFHGNYIPCWITSPALTDLWWWLTLLSQSHTPCSLAPDGPICNYNIWVNVSSEWGIGLLWGNHWATWQLLDGWRGLSRDIGWLEGVAFELAILATRVMGIHNANVLIQSDNEGIIGAFLKGHCSNFMMNMSIRRSDEVYSEVGISTTLIYVNTVDNLADPISCGILPPSSQIFPLPIPIPLPLISFFSHVAI